ncbi:MAG TPA: mannosyltransferase family protein [Vicinamibacterales bacterium]
MAETKPEPASPKPGGEGEPAPPKPQSGEGGWVQAADAAALASLLLGLFVLIFGGFILHLGPVPLRVHGAGRLLFLAVALVAIRHAAHPEAPLHRRLVRALRGDGTASAVSIARASLLSRVAVLVAGYFAVVTIGLAQSSVGFTASSDPALNLPARFDAAWYAGIALDGYYFEGRFDKQQNVAFFPAFPLLERVIGYPLGAFAPAVPRERRLARLLWGGVILSLITFAWAAVYVWRLARDTIGEDRASAAVALLAAYPFAVFFSAAYTESLFLLGAAATIYHFRRRELVRAAGWGLLVGLTRPNGCFLSVVLALLIVEKLRFSEITKLLNHQITKSLAAASAPGIGMLIYSAYVRHLTGSWFGWARLHAAWGRSYSGLAPVERAYGWITDEGLLHVVEGVPFDTLNSLGVIFALVMLWPVFRRLGVAYAAFVLVNLVPPLLAGGVLSMGRLSATLFPLFLALAASVSPRTVTPLVTAFAMGQGLAAALFFTWRPLF